MATLAPGSLAVLPWARQGLAGSAVLNRTAKTNEGRLELPVRLRLNERAEDPPISFR